MKRLLNFAFFILLFAAFFNSALAQNPPPGQEPGAQAERFKQQTDLEKKQFEKKKAKAPPIEIQQKEEKPAAEGASFTLKKVTVTGATVFKPEAFQPIYQPYLNKKVTFKDIEAIISRIKAKYKEKGCLTTDVYLPEQEIKEGQIEIRVMEGKMGKLSIEGNRYFAKNLIEKYFHLKKNEILDLRKVERDILRLNKTSDLEVKTVISPGKEPETSDVTLKVKDKFPWHLGVGFDNQGTRLTGKYRPSVFLRSTNATGRGDSLFLNTLYTGHSFGESAIYNLPVGTYGTTFGLEMTYFKMKLGKEFKVYDITGTTQIYTPHLSWELALQEDFEAYASIGMDIKAIKKKAGGNVTASDQLRLPYFDFNFTRTDASGQNNFSPKFTFGTENFLGASSRNHPTASRAGTGGFFFKYEQAFSRIQRMPLESYLSIRSNFQIPTHTLPSSEQMQLGGANSIRGYPEGDYLADFGGNLNLDWVFPLYLIPKKWKLANSDVPLRQQIQPVLFFDAGGGILKKVLSGEKHEKFLAGIGGGLRLRFFNKIYLRLDWAKHLGDQPTLGSGPSTFYFTLQSEI